MKKLILVIFVFLILFISSVFIFIPNTIISNSFAVARCSATGASRVLAQRENWEKIWVGTQNSTHKNTLIKDGFFVYNSDTFRISKLMQNAVLISITSKATEVKSLLLFLPLTADSVQIRWSYQTPASYNPVIRILEYRRAVRIKKAILDILHNIVQFVDKSENIYGFAVQQTSTKDTFLVSTKTITKTYPSTVEVYKLIEKLQAYANEKGAIQTGYPMMNATQLSNGDYVLMTAIPVNKLLPEKRDINYKRMIPGNFLTATITGGTATVNNAQIQMQQYIQDYDRTVMAIPFQYLITDRTKESDTSKWITKLYYPVM